MWTATTDGFFSVVAHRHREGYLLVRARSLEDIVTLRIRIERITEQPQERPTQTVDADYPWRLEITRTEWAQYLADQAHGIEYDNFKNAVYETNAKRAGTYGRVWEDLLAIEDEPQARPGRTTHPWQLGVIRNGRE